MALYNVICSYSLVISTIMLTTDLLSRIYYTCIIALCCNLDGVGGRVSANCGSQNVSLLLTCTIESIDTGVSEDVPCKLHHSLDDDS